MPAPRKVPRPFEMHWGAGQIVEEAACVGEYHEPAVQLMEYASGDAAGGWSIRFGHYSPRGVFQRSPLMIGESELESLRQSLKNTPRLRALLRRLVE